LGWFGLVLGFAGVAMIAGPRLLASGGGAASLGLVFVVAATSGVAIGNIAIKKVSLRVDPAMAMGLQLLIGAAPITLLASFNDNPLDIQWSVKFMVSLIGLALPGTALAYWLWQKALQTLDVSKAAAFSFLVPLIGVSVGALLFDEPITGNVIVGAGFAAIGVYLAARPSQSKSSHLTPETQAFPEGSSGPDTHGSQQP